MKDVSYTAPSESTIFKGAVDAAAKAGPAGPSPEPDRGGIGRRRGRQGRHGVKDKEDPYADVGRNDPCPCGSGKKYKKCHGANA